MRSKLSDSLCVFWHAHEVHFRILSLLYAILETTAQPHGARHLQMPRFFISVGACAVQPTRGDFRSEAEPELAGKGRLISQNCRAPTS